MSVGQGLDLDCAATAPLYYILVGEPILVSEAWAIAPACAVLAGPCFEVPPYPCFSFEEVPSIESE